MKYNKLVRDRIPEIIKKRGGKLKFHVASSNYEFWNKLKEKLEEECGELLEAIEEYVATEDNEEKLIEETADFLEVLDAVLRYRGERGGPLIKSQIPRVMLVKRKKAQKRGQFKKRIILEES
ncbi:MAG: hypothetical protein A3B86_00740 [Candidatus Yanofskybacteria bacterium RIFCSPHIGHO2_02_FULL_38_22b]|uniref:NTP pyrophosphohydrolase MazG-like domain-containing protein n=1 Tax=Candidatus Yanofskybacteria bacterium RIFCSPHIGHO2_02_FULL_38_22b TaxID=1802673 RepID=A0A1F8F5S4_9BACT|nr:MAG: hypothetical protein A2816_03525 [Candidatus Yanofskybacteria bacterium RIFCSPHIGHO2_01_FULL_39_44]OGN07606.1 MAG: hypothetical protein A3B86_00740 [Candidatus Yanofskybacteria bacterium RIFCSPHIGHO2_02_FULL_38_22b]OGN20235.1 MAG: hypothetical protein A2910_00275 [Candidatus Yanofskybacteria bacterium RIFCSPLOWO2_01_FULL_39_28]